MFVKVFRVDFESLHGNIALAIENEIDEWLGNHPEIEVVSVSQVVIDGKYFARASEDGILISTVFFKTKIGI